MSEHQEWKISSADGAQTTEIVGDMLVLDEKASILAALLTGRGMQGRRSIPLANITAVQVKRSAGLSPGYIHFSCIGRKEFGGGLMEATRDPNTMLFGSGSNDAVEAFAAEVERRRSQKPQLEATDSASAIVAQIQKLADLTASGALTETEFVQAKRKLLGE